MKLKLLLLSAIVLSSTHLFSQSQLATDTSVKVLPHWKKGETHSLVIKSSTEEFADGKSKKSATGFEVRFTVSEKDTSGYTIEWVYTKATLPPDEMGIENIILANLLNQKLIFKISLTGRFKELINFDEVKSAFDPVIERLIAGSEKDRVRNLGFKAARQMLTNQANIEFVLLKQAKFYNSSFGFKYRTHFVQTNKLTFPNALGGAPFRATEKVRLTKLDTANGDCTIERNTNLDDPAAFKSQVFSYLQTLDKQDSSTIRNRFGDSVFELSEISVQNINYLKGIPLTADFTTVLNYGFENRTNKLDIETIQ